MKAVATRAGRPPKHELDALVAESVRKCGEWCHNCYEDVRVLEIMSVSRTGLMAVRVMCPACGRSWGIGVGNNLFWREDD